MGGQLHRLLVASLFLVATRQTPSIAAPNLHFYCNTGYNRTGLRRAIEAAGGRIGGDGSGAAR